MRLNILGAHEAALCSHSVGLYGRNFASCFSALQMQLEDMDESITILWWPEY
jgi:hypothetical protein